MRKLASNWHCICCPVHAFTSIAAPSPAMAGTSAGWHDVRRALSIKENATFRVTAANFATRPEAPIHILPWRFLAHRRKLGC
jgi:hypothetical protein